LIVFVNWFSSRLVWWWTFVFSRHKANRLRKLSLGASISPFISHFWCIFYVIRYGSSATLHCTTDM